MPPRRFLLLIFVILLLGAFLWATININREVEVASFTTSLEGRSMEQIENLQLAAAKIDGVVVKPVTDEGRIALTGILTGAWAIMWIALTLRAIFGKR